MSLRERLARVAGRTLGRAAGRVARRWDSDDGGRLSSVLPSGRRLLDVVAGVAGAGAAASLAGLLPPALVRTLAAGARPAMGVLGVATVTVVLLTWGTDETDDGEEWTAELRATAPERVPAGEAVPPGAWVTVAAGEDDRIANAATVGRYGDGIARERLADAAVETLTVARDIDETTARSAVEDGTWTDDPRAAAYLADGATPTVPPATRLRDWLAGERQGRRVRATVRAISRLDPANEESRVPEPTTDAVPEPTMAATGSTEPTEPESFDPEPTTAVEPGREPVTAATDGGKTDGVDDTASTRPTETGRLWPPGDAETGVRREVEE